MLPIFLIILNSAVVQITLPQSGSSRVSDVDARAFNLLVTLSETSSALEKMLSIQELLIAAYSNIVIPFHDVIRAFFLVRSHHSAQFVHSAVHCGHICHH
jgi:hypothetical protein